MNRITLIGSSKSSSQRFEPQSTALVSVKVLLTCLFLLVSSFQVHAGMFISFPNGGFATWDAGQPFGDNTGNILNTGASGYYLFSWTQITTDDFNLSNPGVSVNAIGAFSSGTIFFPAFQNRQLGISGIVPSSVENCDEAKFLLTISPITGGNPIATYTYTIHIGDNSNSFDLVVRDDAMDTGEESYVPASEFASPDIWIRRQADGMTSHQNPDFVSINSNANKLYTRVHNVGCLNSTNANLRLYWTRARTHETWDDHWLHYTNPSAPNNYTIFPAGSGNQRPLGGEITILDPTNGASASSPVSLPVLAPGQSHVISPVDYFPPNPIIYMDDGDPIVAVDGVVHPAICLLARIESAQDPMNNEGNPRDIKFNVRDNNNIAARNTYVTNDPAYLVGPNGNGNYNYGWVSYGVNNPNSTVEIVDLGVSVSSNDTENPFQDYGNVNIALSNGLWAAWEAAGFTGTGIQTIAPGLIRLTDPANATLNGITLNPGAEFQMAFQYDFFGNAAVSNDLVYDFQLAQYPTGSPSDMRSPNHMITVVEASVHKDAMSQQTDSNIQELRTYPNPAEGSATISFSLTVDTEVTMVLRDLQGRAVVRIADSESFASGQHILPLDLKKLASGTYFLHLQTSKGLLTHKIIHTKQD